MDISCVFVVSKYGDVILSKDYLFDGILGKFAPEFRQRLLNELDDDDVDEDDERRLPDQKPYFTSDDATAYFLTRNDIYLVSCCFSRLSRPPILALDFLSSIFDLLCSFCRLPPENLDAKRLLKHQILVLEILDEVAAKGQAQVTSPDTIRNLVYSPQPAHVSSALDISTSSSSIQKLAKLLPNSSFIATPQLNGPEVAKIFDPGLLSTAYAVIPSALRHAVSSLAATARQASSDGDVFVDVVERVSLKLSTDGNVELFRLQGQLVVEKRFKGNLSLGASGFSSPKIKLFLPENIIFEQNERLCSSMTSSSSVAASNANEDDPRRSRGFTGSTTVLSKCVFHPRCRTDKLMGKDGIEKRPEVIVDVSNGDKVIALTYEVNRESMKNPPPLHVDLSVAPRTSSSSKSVVFSADVSIVLTSRMPPMTKAAAIKVTLPIPDYILQATRLTTSLPYIQGVEQSMDFDRKNSRVIWSIRHLPGKSCVDLKTRLTWQLANNSSPFSSTKENEDYDDDIGPPSSFQFIASSPSSSPCGGAPSAASPAASGAPAAPYNLDVGPAFLEFELSGFSQSGFRIEALKFVDSSFASTAKMKKDTQNVNRWLRYITLDGKVYLFATR